MRIRRISIFAGILLLIIYYLSDFSLRLPDDGTEANFTYNHLAFFNNPVFLFLGILLVVVPTVIAVKNRKKNQGHEINDFLDDKNKR